MECPRCGRPVVASNPTCPLCGTQNTDYYSRRQRTTQREKSSDNFSLLSVIFGVISLLSSPYPFFCLSVSIVGVIISLQGLEYKKSKCLATAGLMMNLLFGILSVFLLLHAIELPL